MQESKAEVAEEKRVWRRGVMRVISPFGIADVNGRDFMYRFDKFVKSQNPEEDEKWQIDWDAFRDPPPMQETLSDTFEAWLEDGYWQRLDEVLQQGPRGLRIRSRVKRWKSDGTYDWDAEAKDENGKPKQTTDGTVAEAATIDAFLLDIEGENRNTKSLAELARQSDGFVRIYLSPPGTIQKATYELIVSRLLEAHDGTVYVFNMLENVCRAEAKAAHHVELADMPGELRIQIQDEQDIKEIERLRSEYEQRWEAHRAFVRDILANKVMFEKDPVGNAKRATELLAEFAGDTWIGDAVFNDGDFIGLRNFANIVTGSEMNCHFDPWGVKIWAYKEDLHNVLTMTIVNMIKNRLTLGGNKGGWRERVFIQLHSAGGYSAKLDLGVQRYGQEQIHKWLFSDQPEMFDHIDYIMPAVYQAHREYMIRQMMMAAGPELHAQFRAQREARAAKEAAKAKRLKSKNSSSSAATVLAPERKPALSALIPHVMAFMKGKYKT